MDLQTEVTSDINQSLTRAILYPNCWPLFDDFANWSVASGSHYRTLKIRFIFFGKPHSLKIYSGFEIIIKLVFKTKIQPDIDY